MKRFTLRELIFVALCCDLGLFAKRIINPVTNLLTDFLHIPGGIGTSFSLMFLVIAAAIIARPGCGTLCAAVQSIIALCMGMTGSMGALSPIGYILPGLVIDLIMACSLPLDERMLLANLLSAVCAALTANIIVFHLQGAVLLLYLSVAAVTGAYCGLLGARVAARLLTVLRTGRMMSKREERS